MYRNELNLKISSLSENEAFARSCVASFCLPLKPSIETITDIKTAVSEAVTNCVVHAYQKRQSGNDLIKIECKLFPEMLEVIISDQGIGISNISQAMEPFFTTDKGKGIENIERAMEPMFTTNTDGERSGMGFTVMQSFMDQISVNNQNGGGTVVTMKKYFTKDKKEVCGE